MPDDTELINGVWAYVSLKPCGCWCEIGAPRLLPDMMRKRYFREAWAEGRVKALKSREELSAIPFDCDACSRDRKAGSDAQ